MSPAGFTTPVAITGGSNLVPRKLDRGEKVAVIVEFVVSDQGELSIPNQNDQVRDTLLETKLNQALADFATEDLRLDFDDAVIISCEFNGYSRDGGNDIQQAINNKFDNTLFLKNGREFQFVVVGSNAEPLIDLSCRRRIDAMF